MMNEWQTMEILQEDFLCKKINLNIDGNRKAFERIIIYIITSQRQLFYIIYMHICEYIVHSDTKTHTKIICIFPYH